MHSRIQHASLCAVIAAALMAASGSVGSAESGDPLHGTWKLNVAKSKFTPGPAPKSATLEYEGVGEGVKVTVDMETDQGKGQWGYTASYDGKDYAVSGSSETDGVSLKRIDKATTQATLKKGGKAMTTNTRVVSADGKTLTITVKGTDAKGRAVDNVQVYEKQ